MIHETTMKGCFQKWLMIGGGTLLGFVLGLLAYSYIVVYPYCGNKKLDITGDFTIVDDDEIGFVAPSRGHTVRHHLDSGLKYFLFTDERGARVSHGHDADSRSADIVTIGCSFSWGHGIENDSTYSSRLETKTGLSVCNLSLGSYGTVQSLLRLRRNLDLAPSIVIYGFIADHVRRNLSPCAPNYSPLCLSTPFVAFDDDNNPYIHPPTHPRSVELNRRFYREVTSRSFSFSHLWWGMRLIHSRMFIRQARTDSVARFVSMKYLIRQLQELTVSIRAQLIVVYIPALDQDTTAPPPRELVAALVPSIIFVDMAEPVRKYYLNHDRPLHLGMDKHPNSTAHALIADELARAVNDVRNGDRAR